MRLYCFVLPAERLLPFVQPSRLHIRWQLATRKRPACSLPKGDLNQNNKGTRLWQPLSKKKIVQASAATFKTLIAEVLSLSSHNAYAEIPSTRR
jgi:hypothetical protein